MARSLAQQGLVSEDELRGWVGRLAGSGASWAPGGRIAGLEILRSLGAGGMGAVHLARDLETGAEVAVKTLTLGEDEELQVRFEREAEAQARVGGHPHVVAVHRYGVAGGRAFLVMDVARGGDLAARVRRGPLPSREAAEIASALAAGLAHAHAQGVLHRDLKPANVLFDDLGAPRLTDFGLARIAGAEDLTQTGQVLGTPAYMAPEQASAGAVDERTDVYGLGAILFAALTGRAPFVGPGVFALLVSVSEGGAPPVRSLNPEVPEPLARICDRCLAKSPQDRYPSAQALQEALEDFLAGRGAGRSPWVPLAAISLLLGIGVLVGGALGQGRPEPTAPSATPTGTALEVALAPRERRADDLSQAELTELRDRLRGGRPSLKRAAEVDAALARTPTPPTWLLEAARAPFLSFPVAGAIGVRDLGGGAFLVWNSKRTSYYDAWNTNSPRWVFAGSFGALSPDGTCALLVRPQGLRLVDFVTGSVLLECLLPDGVLRARFRGSTRALVAVNRGKDRELIVIDLLRGESAGSLGVVEGLKDFELTKESLLVAWGGARSDFGGLSLRSLQRGAKPGERGPQTVGDGSPSVLARGPGGARVAMGTIAGRLQVFPTSGPGAHVELKTAPLGPSLGKAQRSRVERVVWLGAKELLSQGEQLHLWREDEEGWRHRLAIDLGSGLRAFDVSADGRRLLAVSGGRVTQRLLAGYLPGLASGEPFYQPSERARVVLAYARYQAERSLPAQANRERDRERARAGAAFAARSLTLSPALREKVQAWRPTLGQRRTYQAGSAGSFQKRGATAEAAGALDKALAGYLEDLLERPQAPKSHLRVGRVMRQFGDLDSAARYLSRAEALARGPKYLAARAGLLELCASERRHIEEDRPEIEAALARYGSWAE